jgi:hypothetical protein
MSHIVTIQVECREAAAIAAACRRLNLPAPTAGTTRLFSGEVSGVAVQLPDWAYPVVCDTASGQVRFDNFSGRWGNPTHLDRFLQAYAVEAAKAAARRKGHTVSEEQLSDGSVKLTIRVGGGGA